MHDAKCDPESRRFSRGVARKPNFGVSRNILLIGLAGLVAASFSVLGLFIYVNGSTPNPSQQLEIAMRLMRKGDSESPFRLAKAIDSKSLKKKVDLSKREFLLGANERKVAEGIVQQRIARDSNERAVRHLEKSRELSFPEGYEGLGNYYLGMALFDLFRWDEAETPLEVASERWPQGRADAIERLVDIDMSFDNQDAASALERIEHWRSLPRSSADEMDRTVVKEMQVLYAQEDYKKAADLLEIVPSISPQRPNADLFHGRCMQKLADRAREPERSEMINTAMTDFQRVLASTKTSVFARRQSNLELARATRNLGKTTQAVSAFSALRLSSPFESESLVSGLEEIDCLIEAEEPLREARFEAPNAAALEIAADAAILEPKSCRRVGGGGRIAGEDGSAPPPDAPKCTLFCHVVHGSGQENVANHWQTTSSCFTARLHLRAPTVAG